jgi:dTDP-glucose 4,6-dehydratase
MRLLITGGAGFIGHHLIEGVIKNTDFDIVVLDALTYAGNLNRIADIDVFNGSYYEKIFESPNKNRIKFVLHDLGAPISETTHKMIGEIDYVWHLAAESHVDRSLEDSIPFIRSNVLGTANLLEYCKNYQPGLKRFINFSTDEVFGPAEQGVYYKEGDTLNPSNPYSASKEGQEAIAKAFAFSFRMPITITRTMNVFGERQHPEKFVPKTLKAILSGDRVILHGNKKVGYSSRCWIHARNVCDALLYITQRGEIISKYLQYDRQNGIYHIVGEEKSVLEVANMIGSIARKKFRVKEVNFHETRPGHDLRYAMDGSKLIKSGFKYPFSLEQSFNKTINWMIDNPKWLNL